MEEREKDNAQAGEAEAIDLFALFENIRRGILRYKLEDGKPVERTQEEMDADYVPPVPAPTAEDRMTEIESALIELAAMLGGDA